MLIIFLFILIFKFLQSRTICSSLLDTISKRAEIIYNFEIHYKNRHQWRFIIK